jgi:hypothetical protein
MSHPTQGRRPNTTKADENGLSSTCGAGEKAKANRGTVTPVPMADPDLPHEVFRSHLKKMEVGKSSSSCKLSFVTRPHRRSMVQEVWCASYEEFCVNKNIVAHPHVVALRKQLTRVDFVNEAGRATHTRVDTHVLMRDHSEILVSIKYDEKARRKSYQREVQLIAQQCSSDIADRFIVVSRYFFHPAYRKNADAIHYARLGWDPEADRIVLEAANDLTETFTFADVVKRSRLEGRGYRATVRLLGDGDIEKHLLDPIANDTVCWRAGA